MMRVHTVTVTSCYTVLIYHLRILPPYRYYYIVHSTLVRTTTKTPSLGEGLVSGTVFTRYSVLWYNAKDMHIDMVRLNSGNFGIFDHTQSIMNLDSSVCRA